MLRSTGLVVLLGSTACLEPHPDWLGEAGATSSGSSTTSDSTTEGASSGASTTSDSTTEGASSGASTTSNSTTEGASSGASTTSDMTTATTHTDTGVTSTPSTGDTGTGSTTGPATTTGTSETARRIFATSTIHTGNLGGRAGADLFCQGRADAASLTGVWRALISTPAQSAADALALTGPLENMIGEVMAVDGADLWDGSLAAPIGYDEFGASAGGSAWTGTAADGSATTETCEDWSTQVGGFKATLGTATGVDTTWIDNTVKGACSQSYRLYCVSD